MKYSDSNIPLQSKQYRPRKNSGFILNKRTETIDTVPTSSRQRCNPGFIRVSQKSLQKKKIGNQYKYQQLKKKFQVDDQLNSSSSFQRFQIGSHAKKYEQQQYQTHKIRKSEAEKRKYSNEDNQSFQLSPYQKNKQLSDSKSQSQSDNQSQNIFARYKNQAPIQEVSQQQQQSLQIQKKNWNEDLQSSDSSDFSLQSDKFNRFKKKEMKPPLARKSQSTKQLIDVNKHEYGKNSSKFSKNSKKRLLQKSLTSQQSNQQEQIVQQGEEEQQQQQLIVQYDTSQFKGGSMKQRILNYQNQVHSNHHSNKKLQHINHPIKNSKNSNNIHQNKSNLQKSHNQNHQYNHPPLPRKPNKPPKQQSQTSQQQIEIQNSSPKAMMFSIDVKKKNLTLAQAFQINCSRLKRKLENQRQQFKKGNKIYGQQNQSRKINYLQKAESKSNLLKQQMQVTNKKSFEPNQKVERLAMGIKAPVTRKQMYDMTLKNYKQLPEVKRKIQQQRKKQDMVRRLQNVKRLDREVRLRLRYGK